MRGMPCKLYRARVCRVNSIGLKDSRELRWLASQECINRATVMTRRTISSEVVFLCFPGSMPIATLARWIVLDASSGCLFHHSLTFSSCLASVSSLC